MLIVADANVLVRAAVNPPRPAGALLDLVESSALRLAISDHILETVAEKLSWPRIQKRHAVPAAKIRDYCLTLRRSSVYVTPAQGPPIVPGDPEDDIIVYTAVAGRADVICT